MAITNFQSEIWAGTLLSNLHKSLVFAGPGIVNRNYQGTVAAQGDTVRITSIARPTIATYTKGSTVIDPEALTDSQRSLLIDQSKYFAFEVDDIDAAQAAGNMMDEAGREAAYGLADVADQFVAALHTDAQAGNKLGTVSVTTADLAFTQLRKLMVKLDESNVVRDGRYAVMPPWYHGLLLERPGIINVDNSGSDNALRNGFAGRLLGFDLFVSNNCVNVTGDDWAVMAGTPDAITFADQISKVEAFRPQNAFSDALKGLHVYGAKVTRPDGIATVVASIT